MIQKQLLLALCFFCLQEVSSSKSTEPKNTQNVPEPISNEEKVACPICNKQFPMSQIEVWKNNISS